MGKTHLVLTMSNEPSEEPIEAQAEWIGKDKHKHGDTPGHCSSVVLPYPSQRMVESQVQWWLKTSQASG